MPRNNKTNVFKEIYSYLMDFLFFIGILVLSGLLWMGINIMIDVQNPCSNFSDVQDQCNRNY